MTKKQQTIDLWKTCFDDTEAFIQLYFERKYQDENTLVHEENGEVLAALQMLPYPMTWADTLINTSYISGACTLPAARNKGLMRTMLTNAFSQMRQQGTEISTLIPGEPWLYEYYSKLGYAAIFEYSTETHTRFSTHSSQDTSIYIPNEYNTTLVSNCYPYFTRQMSRRSCCIQHPFEDFITIIQDLYIDGGRLLIAYRKDTPEISGLALALPEEDQIWISEILYDTEDIGKALLQNASSLWNAKPVTCKLPTRNENLHRGGMARVIDAGKMLSLYANHHPEKSFTIQLTDAQLPANNGYYSVANGTCVPSRQATSPADFDMNIADLTQALFGRHPETAVFQPQHPYISLMLD